MTALAIACGIVVCVVLVHYRAHSRRQTMAEAVIDGLYTVAAIAYSVAQATDAALVRYRAARQEIRDSHVPMYAEVR